jgi:hypothetical protein
MLKVPKTRCSRLSVDVVFTSRRLQATLRALSARHLSRRRGSHAIGLQTPHRAIMLATPQPCTYIRSTLATSNPLLLGVWTLFPRCNVRELLDRLRGARTELLLSPVVWACGGSDRCTSSSAAVCMRLEVSVGLLPTAVAADVSRAFREALDELFLNEQYDAMLANRSSEIRISQIRRQKSRLCRRTVRN